MERPNDPPGDAEHADASAAPDASGESGEDTADSTRGLDRDAPGGAAGLLPAQRERRARTLGRRAALTSGVAAVLAAVLLGAVIMIRQGGVPFEIDEEWAEEVLALRGPFGDTVALFMNWLGGGIVGVFLVPIGVAIVLLILRRPWGALYFIVASAASAGVVQLLKEWFGRARPEDMLVTSDFGSFPSGHVANAATISVAIGVIVPILGVWIAGAAYTVLMALTRTYLGAHWFSDTVGGLLVGAGVALVLWAAFAVPLERERLAWIARVSERNAARAQARITPPERT